MRALLIPILILLSTAAVAQKENNNWCFGTKCGVNFNTNPPSSFISAIRTTETTATISDRTTGDLLFYTDGKDAYDATHNVMQNGSDMGFAIVRTTAKGAVIVPFANDNNKYYVFTLQYTFNVPGDTTKGRLGYSVVDMTLNNGLGGIIPTQKKIFVDTGFNEGMAAVEDDCGNVWLLLNRQHTKEVYAYRITPTGIMSAPVISQVSYATPPKNFTQLRVSPDRKKIAVNVATGWNPTTFVSLMDFDYRTGKVSNDIIISGNSYHCTEFSPDSRRLYASGVIGRLVQFDISTHNAAVISASEVTVSSDPYFDMMLAPDGNIYLGRNGRRYIDRLSNSNALYPGCVVTSPAVLVGTGLVGIGFPPRVVYPKFEKNKLVTTAWDTVLCGGQVTLEGHPAGTSFSWQNGSTAPSVTVTGEGFYWVLSTPDTGCTLYVDSFEIKKAIDTSATTSDVVMCNNEPITLEAKHTTDNPQYTWDDMSDKNQRTVNSGGTYWVNTMGECDYNTDTFHVTEVNINLSVTNDTTICENTSVVLRTNQQPAGSTYLWSTGTSADTTTVSDEGVYSVTVSYSGCERTGQTEVRHVADISIDLGKDSILCQGSGITLPEWVAGDIESYKWSTGAESNTIEVTEKGRYAVTVQNKCETVTDSIDISTTICHLFFPSAFSPNGDGLNDRARMSGDIRGISSYALNIYNRWGQVVFTTNDPLAGWNGMFLSKYADVGTYCYQIKLTYLNEPHLMKGTIQLIR